MNPYCKCYASVPYTLITGCAKLCHACRSWSLWVHNDTWTGDESRQSHYHVATSCGPFDDHVDAEALLEQLVSRAWVAPGAPWVSAVVAEELDQDAHRQGRRGHETEPEMHRRAHQGTLWTP